MGGITLIREGGDLVEMQERPYDSEDLLQRLLGQHPDLLAGDQIDDGKPKGSCRSPRPAPMARSSRFVPMSTLPNPISACWKG